MNEGLTMPGNAVSFKDFLFKDKRNRTILMLAGITIVIQFSIFKYYYPYASFLFGDSFAYLKAAYFNLSINNYMVGYSRFLRLFSVLTSSDTALTTITYLLIQSSALFLLFTIFYFFKTRLFFQIMLLCFAIFSPLSLYLANLISSDGLFFALSALWFGSLIWIIFKPTNGIIIIHGLILFGAFTVRYNALIYPFLSIIAFLLSQTTLKTKLLGISLGFMLCGLFVFYTSYKHMKVTGHWQYSPFSGWQLANNALYAYRYVDSHERTQVPQKLRALDKSVREYFDSSRDIIKHPQEAVLASSIYMWSPRTPLWDYKENLFKDDTTISDFKKWASVGPLFKDYGKYIISKYPWHFIKYFIWPNSQRYYAPPVEFLEEYNTGRDSVPKLGQIWFDYQGPKVFTRTKNNAAKALTFYPILSGLVNVAICCLLICYTLLNGWKKSPGFNKAILMGTILWITNAGFTIFASPAALRFQSFPLFLATIFTMVLLDWLFMVAFAEKELNREINSKEKIGENAFV